MKNISNIGGACEFATGGCNFMSILLRLEAGFAWIRSFLKRVLKCTR